MTNTNQRADEYLQFITNELDRFRHQLREKNVEYDCPKLNVVNKSEPNLMIEVQVYFRSNGQIVDVFEFPIFKNGNFVATQAELRDWIGEQIGTVNAT